MYRLVNNAIVNNVTISVVLCSIYVVRQGFSYCIFIMCNINNFVYIKITKNSVLYIDICCIS